MKASRSTKTTKGVPSTSKIKRICFLTLMLFAYSISLIKLYTSFTKTQKQQQQQKLLQKKNANDNNSMMMEGRRGRGFGRRIIDDGGDSPRGGRIQKHKQQQQRSMMNHQQQPNNNNLDIKKDPEFRIENQKKRIERMRKQQPIKNPEYGIYEGSIQNYTCQYGSEQFVYPQYPTFIIAGAMKTGTTSLLSYFNKHPLISKPILHEPHFFDKKIFPLMHKSKQRNPQSFKTNANETWCYIGKEYYNVLTRGTTTDKDFDVDEEEQEEQEDQLLAQRQQQSQQQQVLLPFNFEKTPSYLHTYSAPKMLAQTCPWTPKVIITLRNPVDRAYSHYRFGNEQTRQLMHVEPNRTFEDYIREEIEMMTNWNMTTIPTLLPAEKNNPKEKMRIPTLDHPISEEYWKLPSRKIFNKRGPHTDQHHNLILRKGMYAPQIQHWLEHYPKESILVLDYRELQKNTTAVYFKILDFANIPHDQPAHDFNKKFHQQYEPMAPETRRYLEAFYKPYNAQLQHVLGNEWKDVWTDSW